MALNEEENSMERAIGSRTGLLQGCHRPPPPAHAPLQRKLSQNARAGNNATLPCPRPWKGKACKQKTSALKHAQAPAACASR